MASAFYLLLLAILAVGFAAGQLCRNNVTTFVLESFDCLKDRHLKCSGDCTSTADGNLNLTRYDMRSWGRLMYSPGIRLMDPVTTRVAFFSTNFTFSMKGDYSRPGEGLAFLMQGNPAYQGRNGGFLGLYDKDGKAETPTIAVEFDTYRDWLYGFFIFNDINNNHVGVDIESINSKVQVDAGSVGIELGKEQSVTAWIDYIPASENSNGNLQVRISTDRIRPLLPLISYSIDLSKHMAEIMYLGFSATTGDHLVTSDCLSYHSILSWSFHSWGLDPDSPPPVPPPPVRPRPSPPSVLPPVPLPPAPPAPPTPLFPPSPARPPLRPDAPSPSPSGLSPPVPVPAPAPFSPPPPSSILPPVPLPPEPPTPPFPPSPTRPPLTPDAPSPSPSGFLPPAPALAPGPAPFSCPSPSPSPSETPTNSPPSPSWSPPASYPVFPPLSSPPSAPTPDSPVPVPSPDTPIPSIPDLPAPSSSFSPPPAVSPSSPSPENEPSLAPESVPTPSAGPAPSSYVSPPATLPPAPASTPTPSPAPSPSTCVYPAPASTPTAYPVPSPSTPSPNSTVTPSSEPPSPTPGPTSLPAPAPSPASGQLDATRQPAASIAGFALLFGGYAMVVYNRVLSELGDGRHSHRRVEYLGDQTMIEIWPTMR